MERNSTEVCMFKIKRRPRAEVLSPQTTDSKEINSQFILSQKKNKIVSLLRPQLGNIHEECVLPQMGKSLSTG